MTDSIWRRKGGRLCCALLALLLCLGALAGCAGKGLGSAPGLDSAQDLSRVKERGTLLVGVTDYPPMDYLEDGEWLGFDADLARLFGEWLGVEISFVEIDWSKKVQLLESGEIDCIWNGLTKTEELEKKITCSRIYLFNSQVVVMAPEQFAKYDSLEKCGHLLFAVEEGSAGQELAEKSNYRCTKYPTQAEAMESVLDKSCDAAIVDSIIAGTLTAKGSALEGLAYDYSMNAEEICIGLRKGSSLEAELDGFFAVYFADGAIAKIAKNYGIIDALFR